MVINFCGMFIERGVYMKCIKVSTKSLHKTD